MAEIMPAQELAAYLKLHEITICKYAGGGKIPGIRIGRAWRFDKTEIDRWIEESYSQRKGRKKAISGSPMKRRFNCSILFCFLLVVYFSGCYLDPKRFYSGPELPKKDLAFIMQTEDLLYRPIYLLVGKDGDEEVQIDDLGVVVLPGTYEFKAKWYHSRLQESSRIATVPVVPGESDFPVQQPVLRWRRADKPYKETKNTPFTVNAGSKYGLWCTDDEEIKMKILGPYQ